MQRIYVLLILISLSVLLTCCSAFNKGEDTVVVVATPQTSPVPHTASPDDSPTPAESASHPPTAQPPATPTSLPQAVDPSQLNIDIELVADGFDQPLYATGAGDGSERLFVVEKPGYVAIVRNGKRESQRYLDISSKVASRASERGLLSIAFHPDYTNNGQFFVNYTNLQGHTVIARYRVSSSNPDLADPDSEEIILTIEQPASNHNGGLVMFGPDGYLYIGMGDGGAAGDPWGNAQNRTVLLGKLLRIDVDVDVNNAQPYALPPDNPFIDQPDMRPEIWAWGMRNPWRFSFDRNTGDVYIGDVGQNTYEEVHYQPANRSGGENYGWNIMEGAACYPEESDCDSSGLTMPIAVYEHRQGDCSITGGYVYRGKAYPHLNGIYFFADYCSGRLWSLHQDAGTWQSTLLLETGMSISSFGEDDAGELYITDLWNGNLYRLVIR